MSRLVDYSKVVRYFDLCEQTDDLNVNRLSDEEWDLLVDERLALFCETGLGATTDEEFDALAREHDRSQN